MVRETFQRESLGVLKKRGKKLVERSPRLQFHDDFLETALGASDGVQHGNT